MAKSISGGPIESPITFSACGSRNPCECVGRVDQRLRRDTADVEAGSAEPVGFDQDRVEAELPGPDRRDIAARAAADDENLAAKLVHFVLVNCVICGRPPLASDSLPL